MDRVIIVGGGIVGASVAYHLARAGAPSLLFDRRDAGRATDAGAGMLSPPMDAGKSNPSFDLSNAAFEYFSILVDQLQEADAPHTGFDRCGSLLVAATEDEVPSLEQATRVVRENQRQMLGPTAESLHEVTPHEARQLFPPLADLRGAIYCPIAARMDGRLFEKSLLHVAQRHGLEVRHASADQLVIQDGVVRGVEALGETWTATHVVICGGAWTQGFATQLGVHVPVQPQRGQIVHLDLGETDTTGWPFVSGFRDHYLVSWPDHRVVAGATRETGSGFEPVTTAAGIREVLSEALRVAPGLAGARVKEIRVGLRPLAADGLPVLGRIPGIENAWLATGHGPAGLQLGPYSGKLMADFILDQEVPGYVSAFGIERFSENRMES